MIRRRQWRHPTRPLPDPSCCVPTMASLFLLLSMVMWLGNASKDELETSLFQVLHLSDPGPAIQSLLDKGADCNAIGPGGQTPLMHSVLRGYTPAVEFLLEAGADVTIGEKDGYTPLHGAAFQGRADIARLLLEKTELDPLDYHADGFLPIHRACWGPDRRHADTVRVFLQYGVSARAKARNGQTPMDILHARGDRRNLHTQRVIEEGLEWERMLAERGMKVDSIESIESNGRDEL